MPRRPDGRRVQLRGCPGLETRATSWLPRRVQLRECLEECNCVAACKCLQLSACFPTTCKCVAALKAQFINGTLTPTINYIRNYIYMYNVVHTLLPGPDQQSGAALLTININICVELFTLLVMIIVWINTSKYQYCPKMLYMSTLVEISNKIKSTSMSLVHISSQDL